MATNTIAAIKNSDLILYRLEGGTTAFARADLKIDPELDAEGAIEWIAARQDSIQGPFMIHVDDLVSVKQAQAERDAAFRSTI